MRTRYEIRNRITGSLFFVTTDAVVARAMTAWASVYDRETGNLARFA